ncbi:MAG: hypothetical protein K8M05_25290 [Deltaproteobacteria bacterium]|nr:hypothetical protein [Kofleriaceae bacterium]
MRPTQLATCLLALGLAAAPVAPAAADAVREPPAETVPRPATADELARYGEREEAAKQEKLDQFEGGRRGRGVEATTIIIVLLVVIVVLLVI